jgi:hypothetical protein
MGEKNAHEIFPPDFKVYAAWQLAGTSLGFKKQDMKA